MSGSCLSSLGALGALCHPITAQKDVRNQTEGTREHRRMSGSCLSSLGALGALCHPSQHRRMSGTRQKEPGSTEGCQGAQKDVRELSVILGALGALCH